MSAQTLFLLLNCLLFSSLFEEMASNFHGAIHIQLFWKASGTPLIRIPTSPEAISQAHFFFGVLLLLVTPEALP